MKNVIEFAIVLMISLLIIGCGGRSFKDELPEGPNKIKIHSITPAYDRILLAWNDPGYTASTFNYELYRSTTPNFELEDADVTYNIPSTQNTLTDTANVTASTNYYYKLLYRDTNLNIVDTSEEVMATTKEVSDIKMKFSFYGLVPTFSVYVTNYYMPVDIQIFRATGNIDDADFTPTASLLLGSAQISSVTTFNFADNIPSPNPYSRPIGGNTYSYKVYGILANGVTTVNTGVLTYSY